MKYILLILLFFTQNTIAAFSQSLSNEEKVTITNYAKRVYQKEKTDGCRIISHGDCLILLTTITVKESSAMQRIAEVKALRAAGEFIKGAHTESTTTTILDEFDGSIQEVNRDIIKVSSLTQMNKMELLGFVKSENYSTFFFFKELDNPEKRKKK